MSDELQRIRRLLAAADFAPLGLKGAEWLRVASYGTGGRPMRLTDLGLDCWTGTSRAHVKTLEGEDEISFAIIGPLLLVTAASLASDDGVSQQREIVEQEMTIDVDGRNWPASALVQGDLLAVAARLDGRSVRVAAAGVEALQLTDAVDLDRAVANSPDPAPPSG